MRWKNKLYGLLALCLASSSWANWVKVSETDYSWGPFKIYHIALFSETGDYQAELRPLMLTLNYERPVDGRDFAISLARSWSNLGITLPEQDDVITRLKKNLPDLKPSDSLSYIALEDKGYFVLNDTVLPEEFNREFNNAILAIWLDPRVDLSQILTVKKAQPSQPDPETKQQDNEPQKVPQAEPAESKEPAQPMPETKPITDPIPVNKSIS